MRSALTTKFHGPAGKPEIWTVCHLKNDDSSIRPISGWNHRGSRDGRTYVSSVIRKTSILVAMDTLDSTPIAPSLDGRRFVMESSSNSTVDSASPSSFQYFERDGVIWGDYSGDTVDFGRFVGTRVGNHLSVSFAHVTASDGLVATGTSKSTVEATPQGIRLIERFRIGRVDHISICVEASSENVALPVDRELSRSRVSAVSSGREPGHS